jgi:oligopeptide/dipeptide ABC transporter ATP-binding protein
MYAGQVVEEGATADIITDPRHPYTRALLDALPTEGQRGKPAPASGRRGPLRSIGGSPPSLIDVPAGCRFAARCRYAVAKCRTWDTELLPAGQDRHVARCWRQGEIEHETGRSQA